MNVLRLFTALLCMWTIVGYAVVPYHTEIRNKGIKTLQVRSTAKKSISPVIELNGPDAIEINFDVLPTPGWFAYSIVHCNADWSPSVLSSREFINGYQNLFIDDFSNSLNTRVNYTNYRLFLPNEDVQFKVSGNYVVKIYNENTPNDIALTVCFSVVETQVNITGEKPNSTDTTTRQQVNFVVNHPNHNINFPQMDIKAFVYQNNTREYAARNIVPTQVSAGQIIFRNDAALLFDAGNEYRRLEFLNTKTLGMHILAIQPLRPHTVELMTDYPRGNKPYIYDHDQNGRFRIRNNEVEDPDTEADYQPVYFTLKSDSLAHGNVYLYGNLFQHRLNNQSIMTYNSEKRMYEKTVLLKQGGYNYQYIFAPEGENTTTRKLLEGNFSQTENEYAIFIFYRPMGIRYDQLIGVKTITSGKGKM